MMYDMGETKMTVHDQSWMNGSDEHELLMEWDVCFEVEVAMRRFGWRQRW